MGIGEDGGVESGRGEVGTGDEGGDRSDGTGTWSGWGRTSKKRPRMTFLTNGAGRGGMMAKGVLSNGSGERAGEGVEGRKTSGKPFHLSSQRGIGKGPDC